MNSTAYVHAASLKGKITAASDRELGRCLCRKASRMKAHRGMVLRFMMLAFVMAYIWPASAQTNVFSKAYDLDSLYNSGRSIAETNEGGFIVSGTIHRDIIDMQYFLLDNKGDSIWRKDLNLSANLEIGENIFVSGQSFIAIGSIFDTAATKMYVLYLRLSGSGQLEAVKQIDAGYRPFGVKAKKAGDHFIVTANSYSDSTHTDQYAILLKIDASGSRLWQKEFALSSNTVPAFIDVTSDNGFVIGGRWTNPSTQNNEFFLIKTDNSGNLVWQKNHRVFEHESYYQAALTPDEGFAIVGARRINTFTINGLLVKLDNNGDLIWEKLFGLHNHYHYFHKVISDSKGNFIIVGSTQDAANNDPPITFITKADPIGNVLWTNMYTYYGPGTVSQVSDLILTSDGGYAITGHAWWGPLGTRKDLWVLKTDHLGRTCDSPPCHAVLWDTQTAVLPLPAPAKVTLAPNPTTGQLTLTLAEPFPREAVLSVYDVQGCTSRQWRLSAGQGQFTVQLGLPSGLYLYRVTSSFDIVLSGKLSIAR